MKMKLLFSMLLLFAGVSMQAQSVDTEQMDERFNDGTKLPYGWFTEGWTVKDGAIQTKSSGFDLGSLFGGGDDPEGSGSPDISSLLSSLMGGGEKNYLLTPPLVVNEGETLVFSAKKGKKDNSGSGSTSSFSFGSSDSTFVVERTVYSHNEWLPVAEFTTELDTIYKTFTISDTPAGEYRFRFKAGGTVLIDSVAGFHLDNEAPDIYVVDKDAPAKDIDFSLCTEDSTRTLTIINTATGTLNVNITSSDNNIFSVSPDALEVEAADSLDVNVTFNFAAGLPGLNESDIFFLPTDQRVYGKALLATAVVTQPDVWVEDFNANKQPKGFFTEGWEFHDNVATTSSGYGGSSFLMTPPLTIESTDDVLLFSAKKGGGGSGLGMLMGGGSSSVVIEKSVYGSNKWEKVKEYTESLDSVYRVLWVSYIEPGEYRFRIIASDSIVVDSIAGFHIDNNAPDIYVLHNNTAAKAVNFGMPQANGTEALAIVNTGTGTLQVGVALTNETDFSLSANTLDIEANDTAMVDVNYLFDEQAIGVHQGVITFTPSAEALTAYSVPVTAYSTYDDAWTEDFEPEFVVDDETQPREFPEGWETTGWEVTFPSSGGGLMDMLGGITGGSSAPKSWMATTNSAAYELITPRLEAMKGDVLGFQMETGGSGGGLMDMLGAFMGCAASGALHVYYRLDNDTQWKYYDTFVENGNVYFIAPYSGVYQLRFTSAGAKLDNFYGFRIPSEEGDLSRSYSLNVSDAGMATLYLDYPVAIPEDDNMLGVFIINNIDGHTLYLKRLKETIPSDCGVIVMANPGEFAFNETRVNIDVVEENMLSGTAVEINVADIQGTVYTLGRGKNSGYMGFHKYSNATLPANKAFLVRNADNSDSFVIDRNAIDEIIDSTTGVTRLVIEDEELPVIYDLQGRLVEHPGKGVYIVNGKKKYIK